MDKEHEKVSRTDVVYVLEMMISCMITYWIITAVLHPFVEKPDEFLGGMWAVVATVFVFRNTKGGSFSAGVSRMVATCVSFALCLGYFLILPFHVIPPTSEGFSVGSWLKMKKARNPSVF